MYVYMYDRYMYIYTLHVYIYIYISLPLSLCIFVFISRAQAGQTLSPLRGPEVPTPAPVSSASLQRSTQSQLLQAVAGWNLPHIYFYISVRKTFCNTIEIDIYIYIYMCICICIFCMSFVCLATDTILLVWFP